METSEGAILAPGHQMYVQCPILALSKLGETPMETDIFQTIPNAFGCWEVWSSVNDWTGSFSCKSGSTC